MNIDQLAQLEKEELKGRAATFTEEVKKALEKIRGKRVYLQLKEQDQIRLLKLRVWAERYYVDVRYILTRLIPFWEHFIVRRSKTLKSEGLGVRVATLVGKKSQELLESFIQEDFPYGSAKLLRRHSEQDRMLRNLELNPDGIKTACDSPRSIFDFYTPRVYVEYYRRRIRKQQKARERFVQQMQEKPYRGNPWL